MHFTDLQGRRYAQFERLRGARGLTHAFCMRPMNVSPRPESRQRARGARRAQMALDLGLDPARLSYCVQVHETRVAVIDGPRPGGALEGYDAVATDVAGQPLMTFSADCPLVLVYDPVRRVVGMAHASWRCTVAGIAGILLATMRERWGCEPRRLVAAIGPAAGPCCYEVQTDVFEAAADLPDRERLFDRRAGRLYFDLWRANRVQLCAAGVLADNVETAGICTLCRNDLFYSFRREGSGCGHFGLMAALTERQTAC